ncbi:MAG: MopE-related protein [Sandaracinaceae bacterium]|nr:MopE-related protein [Sandaracinaceae bacterium]
MLADSGDGRGGALARRRPAGAGRGEADAGRRAAADAGRGPPPMPDGGPPPMPDGGTPPPLPDAGPPTCATPDTWYRDFDMDGQGDAEASVESCDPVVGFVLDARDCDDTCATCYSGAAEVCDGRDNDCDGSSDEGVTTAYYLDADGDGHGNPAISTSACAAPSGYVSAADDCDDTCGACWTGASESCDGRDNDCDGSTDEGVTTTYYLDADGDGRGNPSIGMPACARPSGYVESAGDCDDTCSACWTGASESCDGRDNDCDGSTDEGVTTTYYLDADGDGRGDPSRTTAACSRPTGHVENADDCDDACSACWTGASESCDGRDNDCDGSSDEGVTTRYYRDADGDGHGNPSLTADACSAPSGYVAVGDDCNDGCPTCYPGRTGGLRRARQRLRRGGGRGRAPDLLPRRGRRRARRRRDEHAGLQRAGRLRLERDGLQRRLRGLLPGPHGGLRRARQRLRRDGRRGRHDDVLPRRRRRRLRSGHDDGGGVRRALGVRGGERRLQRRHRHRPPRQDRGVQRRGRRLRRGA